MTCEISSAWLCNKVHISNTLILIYVESKKYKYTMSLRGKALIVYFNSTLFSRKRKCRQIRVERSYERNEKRRCSFCRPPLDDCQWMLKRKVPVDNRMIQCLLYLIPFQTGARFFFSIIRYYVAILFDS